MDAKKNKQRGRNFVVKKPNRIIIPLSASSEEALPAIKIGDGSLLVGKL